MFLMCCQGNHYRAMSLQMYWLKVLVWRVTLDILISYLRSYFGLKNLLDSIKRTYIDIMRRRTQKQGVLRKLKGIYFVIANPTTTRGDDSCSHSLLTRARIIDCVIITKPFNY